MLTVTPNRSTHRAGEHLAGVPTYPRRQLIATHEEPMLQLVAADYVGPLQWGVTAGQIHLTQAGRIALLVPPNRTQTIVVTTEDLGAGGPPVYTTITVYSTFPIAPAWEYEVKYTPTTQKSEGEDRSAAFRRRAPAHPDGRGGNMLGAWSLTMPGRELVERQLYEAHHQYHDIDLEFYLLDAGSDYPPRLVRYVTGFGVRVHGYQRHTISCDVAEVAPGDSFLAVA